MRNDKHLAIKLRRQEMSYKKISKELSVPTSTLNSWFKKLAWSNIIKDKLTERAVRQSGKRIRQVIQANQEKWAKRREGFRQEAVKEFAAFKNSRLFIAGLMLYWGEGDQNVKYPVRLTNTNYKMIALFKKFLLDICRVNIQDLRLALFIYPDLSDKNCKKFWGDHIGMDADKFEKTQVIYGKHPTKRLANGICSIRVRKSSWLKEKILVWIDLMSENLIV
jgi:hypothetical protein